MSSIVEICNMGFVLIGEEVIEALGDNNDREVIATRYYADTRDAVLRAHPWGFAKVSVALAEAAGNPVFTTKWGYHFTLPVDPYCLRVLGVEEDFPGQIPYSIEARKLLTNESSIKILYIAQIIDSGLFDSLFADCLAARLAASFAMALSKQKTLVEWAWKLYELRIPEARTVDGLEATKEEIYNATLTSVR